MLAKRARKDLGTVAAEYALDMAQRLSTNPAAPPGSTPAPLLGFWVLRPIGTGTPCETCGRPSSRYGRGKVIRQISPEFVLVEWWDWSFGETIKADVWSVDDIRDGLWFLYADYEDYDAHCRGFLAEHDHARNLRFARNYLEEEPPRAYLPVPTPDWFAGQRAGRGGPSP